MAYGLERGEDGRWVERCDECHFDGASWDTTSAQHFLRSLTVSWRNLLDRAPSELLRTRPQPATWSPVEYLAHCRDVTTLLREIVRRHATEDDPMMPERLATDGLEVDVEATLAELDDAASGLADDLDAYSAEDLARPVVIAGKQADVLVLVLHAVHDADHHLFDVRRQLVGHG
jgi:DinB superfamily